MTRPFDARSDRQSAHDRQMNGIWNRGYLAGTADDRDSRVTRFSVVRRRDPDVRLATDGRGHEEIRRRGRVGVNDGIKVHRLCARAWGDLESYFEPVEIDHLSGVEWDTRDGNLDPEESDTHARRTRRRAQRRNRPEPPRRAQHGDD